MTRNSSIDVANTSGSKNSLAVSKVMKIGLRSLSSNPNIEPRVGRRNSVVSSNINEQSFATSSEYFILLEEDFPIDVNLIKEFYRKTKKRACLGIDDNSLFQTKV